MLCLYDTSLLLADLFPDLIVLTSPPEHSEAPKTIFIYLTLHATKPITLVNGREWLKC